MLLLFPLDASAGQLLHSKKVQSHSNWWEEMGHNPAVQKHIAAVKTASKRKLKERSRPNAACKEHASRAKRRKLAEDEFDECSRSSGPTLTRLH